MLSHYTSRLPIRAKKKENMGNRSEKKYENVTVIQRADYLWGVVGVSGEVIVPFGKYGWIDGFDQGLARVRGHGQTGNHKGAVACFEPENGTFVCGEEAVADYYERHRRLHSEEYAKWGIINEKGEEVLPVEYDNIWNFLGKNRYSTRVEKDGQAEEIYFHDLNPSLPEKRRTDWTDEVDTLRREETYEEYRGSYAQDVMGWSDQDIDDVFDGDPDAYWNID